MALVGQQPGGTKEAPEAGGRRGVSALEIVPEQAARPPAVEAETELHASLPHHKGTLLVPAHPAAKSLPPSTDKSCVLLPPYSTCLA